MHGTAFPTDPPTDKPTARLRAVLGTLAMTAAGDRPARRGWAPWL